MIVLSRSNGGVAFDNNYRFFGRTAWQWQPTLTVHDPNPPITLEDAAVAAEGWAHLLSATRNRLIYVPR